MTQKNLFAELDAEQANREQVAAKELRRMSRSTDHASSHAAAEAHVKSRAAESNRQRCVDLVYIHPGCTSKELAQKCDDLDRYEIARRLPECERRNLIRAEKQGKKPITWWPPEGK